MNKNKSRVGKQSDNKAITGQVQKPRVQDLKMLPAVITEPSNWRKLPRPLKKLIIRAHVGGQKAGHHFKDKVIDKLPESGKIRGSVIRWMLMLVALLLAVGLQFNWYQNIYQTEALVQGGTYAEGALGKVSTLNPLFASTRSEQVAARLLFSRLYSYDTSGSLGGDLAEKLESKNDGQEYEITLRGDASWQDGEKITADDVIFTLDLIKNPRVGSTLYTTWRDINSSKLSENLVKFTLPETLANFSESLTFPILPEHILREVDPEKLYENEFSHSPVGSGPFTFRTLTGNENQSIHLSANQSYYDGAPRLEKFVIHTYDTREEITKAINNGEISGSAELSITDLGDITNGSINVRETLINSGVFAFLNTKSPTLSDARVRRAVQRGVDMNALRTHVADRLEQEGLPAQTAALTALNLPILESQLKLNIDLSPYGYDSAAAQNWVKEVYGDKTPSLRLVTISRGTLGIAAENLKSQLGSLGFQVDLEIVDPSLPGQDFGGNIIAPRAYDILIYEIEMGSDPDMFAYYYSGNISQTGFNLSNYSSALVDELLISARTTTDTALRTAKYEAFARRWLSDVPAIGLYQAKMTYFYNKNVTIFSPNNNLITNTDRFADVLYWSASKANKFRTP